MIKGPLFFILSIFTQYVLAEDMVCTENCPKKEEISPSTIDKVVDKLVKRCGETTLEIDESCMSSKGFEFKYIGKNEHDLSSFLDVTSNIIWEDKLPKVYKFTDAAPACEKSGSRLPIFDEVSVAEEHGFREALPNSGYSYTSKDLLLRDKQYDTHMTYWMGDTFTRTRFGFLDFKKAYAYKMSKKYYEAYEIPGDADTSYLNVRCIRSK